MKRLAFILAALAVTQAQADAVSWRTLSIGPDHVWEVDSAIPRTDLVDRRQFNMVKVRLSRNGQEPALYYAGIERSSCDHRRGHLILRNLDMSHVSVVEWATTLSDPASAIGRDICKRITYFGR